MSFTVDGDDDDIVDGVDADVHKLPDTFFDGDNGVDYDGVAIMMLRLFRR